MQLAPTLVIGFLLTGCGTQGPEGLLEDYVERVAGTLDRPLPALDPLDTLLLPRRSERRLPLAETRAGLLEALDLAACDLLPLVAERNSSLGKVKTPSTLMDYEFRFFRKLSDCYRRDQREPLADQDFSRLLARLYRQKRDNLPAVTWNALFTSPEMERNLSLSRPPLPLAGHPGYSDSLRALDRLLTYRQAAVSAAQSGQLPLSSALPATTTTAYEALHGSEFGSQLFTSLVLLSQRLNQAASVLESAIAERPLCLSGRPVPQARYLKNVFDRYYAQGVQSYLSLVHRRGRAWLERMNALAQQPPSTPATGLETYRRRMLDPESDIGLWHQFQAAIKRHTRAWQDILRQCGLMPRR